MKILILLTALVIISGCQQEKAVEKKPANVILVNFYDKTEQTSTSIYEIFQYKSWVEGTIKNIGELPAKDINIKFPTGYNDIYTEDNIGYLAPGESISFKTNSCPSTSDMHKSSAYSAKITFK